ncbi:YheC/YheD family protein [Bacillus dakarensis]|uniref:YheC/YheD family protein n=1 Tax=Robertmurraya dakarensis TaxID=1926278 RepID=UPI000981E3F4|nr:YheC/YheD family protein [Bacillus dakarensis]
MGKSVGKWTKHKILLQDEALTTYLPETKLFRRDTFHELLEKHGEVIVKPCLGLHGRGVVSVSALTNQHYLVHFKNEKVVYNSENDVYTFLRKQYYSRRKKYIVQQKLNLTSIQNCPFDIRVMVQRTRGSLKWWVTGRLAKVAAKGYLITNAAQAVMPVEEAIEEANLNFSVKDLIAEMDHISLLTANKLMAYYPNRRMIGLDIGLDIYGKLWIIEANLGPDIYMFKKLKDKSVFKKMRWFRKH